MKEDKQELSIQYSLLRIDQTLLLYKAAMDEVVTRIDILSQEFKLTNQYNPIEHLSSRLKKPQSIYRKMQKLGLDFTVENMIKNILDVAGVRIVCKFQNDIQKVVELIESQHDIQVLLRKDYITNPKESGYSSYHMIVTIPVSLSSGTFPVVVEIQIRTIAMDFWAALEHKIRYKYEGDIPAHLKRELKECAELTNFLDRKMQAIHNEVYAEEDIKNPTEQDISKHINEMMQMMKKR